MDRSDPFRNPDGIKTTARPLIQIGPSAHRKISCLAMPQRRDFISAPTVKDAARCIPSAKARLRAEMKAASERFTDETVVFLLSAGAFGKAIAHEIYYEERGIRSKDVVLDIGSSLDALAGIGSRDYNSKWKENCKNPNVLMALDCKSCHKNCGAAATCSVTCDKFLAEIGRLWGLRKCVPLWF